MINRIKQLRKEMGINQAQLAKGIGISTSAVGMYEQGRREPDIKNLLAIAKFFNVSVDYLLSETDQKSNFDFENIAKSIAKNITTSPSFDKDFNEKSPQEMLEINQIIENSVKQILLNKIK